jgi:hypothetical protein
LRGAVEQYHQIEDLLTREDGHLMRSVRLRHFSRAEDFFTSGLGPRLYRDTNQSLQAAIIASVAMAALQLPSLLLSHWLAQPLMAFSLVIGLFSVYAACARQRLVTNLATPMQMRVA